MNEMKNVIQSIPERLSKRMKFFISVGEYSDEIDFITDAVRRLIETKEKSEQELLKQAEIVRTDIWRKKYAGSAGQ
jgi:Arc/MetJ-type ribon-helix-helix transcriptional regulator